MNVAKFIINNVFIAVLFAEYGNTTNVPITGTHGSVGKKTERVRRLMGGLQKIFMCMNDTYEIRHLKV